MDMPPPPPISARGDPDPKITDPFKLCKPLDNYVKAFTPTHGYAIIIGHSGRTPFLYTNYECHRGGKPAKRKPKTDQTDLDPSKLPPAPEPADEKKTRSTKIGCPFKMNASFHKDQRAWTLHHLISHHHHGPSEFKIIVPPSISDTITSTISGLPLPPGSSTPSLSFNPITSQLSSITSRIISMPTPQQHMIVKSINELLQSVCSTHQEVMKPQPCANNGLATDLLNDIEQFQALSQTQSVSCDPKDTDLTPHPSLMFEPPITPTPLDNQNSFDSLDSFQLEALINPLGLSGVKLPKPSPARPATPHDPPSHDYITKSDNTSRPHKDLGVATDQPSTDNNINPECATLSTGTQAADTCRTSQTAPTATSIATPIIEKKGPIPPRRTRHRVADLTVHSGVNGAECHGAEGRTTRSAKRKCNA